ncbi:uncharacterized protein BO87DRAFT_239557 [Aspergillus neoniger CBS 115656]|uniref:Uncharacterized protein n=1 Tax=Aspergillus neoniger (strain CBS 115656) TaxID=1448310 RepID=A0A318YPZ8_ASPNB|nr:hypothetical protein BO87DRAFT_239557 [Aspergillus neoniger CBS 115656]PYH36459.1 hypothetical protein BO87DRAFT_239557 [Aspergillus neoniger CBS 115656]
MISRLSDQGPGSFISLQNCTMILHCHSRAWYILSFLSIIISFHFMCSSSVSAIYTRTAVGKNRFILSA